ncbi:MAG: GWxTD domain-containing protein [candidate division KSB1 bacterium]|nr:GWxTD domain-containing protein [candidate division KSB1 bacterium]MDZ7276075.1 GWxTD domain-containing protein [candidate division KSB1 bacterium]MDZ7287145.1 GWxTD domain-containing protein [candidate division KSB1 bacterium]MDZ7296930.1 GWxTD domain-containing protein [candidate division KSB1 bacterium]MDZ7309391.1 GWxTD domain-containing protein [candidate division KSB1 bacterium]
MKNFIHSFPALLLLLVPLQLSAGVPDEAATWLARGRELLAQNQLEQAHKAFERALRLSPQNREALVHLGQIEVAWGKWGKADDRFEKILERNPNDLTAHYYRGICHREMATTKALLLKKIDFDKAEKHLRTVLAQDSLFQDAVYQLALVKRYREDYEEAIRLGHLAVRLRPDLPGPQVGLFRLYRYLLDHRSTDEALRWLAQWQNDHARHAIGECYRLQDREEKADSIFRELLERPATLNLQPVRLSRARVFYNTGRALLGQSFFWQAVDSIRSKLDADFIFEDMKYILSDAEYDTYLKLQTPEEYRAFFQKMWVKRDPLPASQVNLRLAEHYRRLRYAEKNYAFDGFRTWFNSPDRSRYLKYTRVYFLNHEFNDKGLVYIRQGPPDDTALSVSQRVNPNESWRYFKTPERGELIFHFVIADNAVGNNWRLTPVLTDPDMLAERLHWGPVYMRLLNARESERLTYENEMAEQSVKAVQTGLDSDRHTWSRKIEPLAMAFQTVVFKGTAGRDELALYYAIPANQITRDHPAEAGPILLEKGAVLHDRNWHELKRVDKQIALPPDSPRQFPRGLFIDAHHFSAPPDSYHVAFHVRLDQVTPSRVGGFTFELALPDYNSDRLVLSDLLLAFAVAPASSDGPFVRNGLALLPNPFKQFSLSQPVQLYFEIYNLALNEEGRAQFLLQYTVQALKGKSGGFAGLFGGGDRTKISLTFERETNSRDTFEQTGLDLSAAKPGEYELTVKVTDRVSGASAEAKSMIRLD